MCDISRITILMAESGRCRSTIPGKRDVDDGDAGAHGWRVLAAAADLGVGEAEEAGPGAALKVKGEGCMSAGYGAHLDGRSALNFSDRHVLHLDVDVGATSSSDGLSPQAEVEEEVDC